MPNTYFQFQQFRINQEQSGMKVTTDACLFGAWVAHELVNAQPRSILDIGAGTGLLSLMLAQKNNGCQIDAIERNEDAYTEALHNFQQSDWKDRLNIYHSSLQAYRARKYDVIISNPPFFQDSFKGANELKNQALHSSYLSMEDLLVNIVRLLNKSGSFFLLYPEKEMNLFSIMAEESNLHLTKIVTVKNKKGDKTFRKMGMFNFMKLPPSVSELNIRRENKNYTDEFWHLLRSYYLGYNDPALKK